MPLFSSFEKVTAPKVIELATYWRSLAPAGELPHRNQFDPRSIPRLLPHIMMAEFEKAPFRVRYRLVGTALVEVHGFDFTGCYLDELNFGPSDREDWIGYDRQLMLTAQPVYGYGTTPRESRAAVKFQFGSFPLTLGGGEVDQLVGIEDYDLKDLGDVFDLERGTPP